MAPSKPFRTCVTAVGLDPGGELKRRADMAGSFPNEAAVVRRVGARRLEQNDECAVSRRYMTAAT